MLSNTLVAPSLNSLFVTGFILLAIFITVFNNYKRIMNLNYYQMPILTLKISGKPIIKIPNIQNLPLNLMYHQIPILLNKI